MKESGLFTKLIRSNTGYSSKTFIMLTGVFMTFLMYLGLLPVVYISMLNGIIINWYGIAAVIGSISTFAGVVIWGKVKTDIAEYSNTKPTNITEDGTEVG